MKLIIREYIEPASITDNTLQVSAVEAGVRFVLPGMGLDFTFQPTLLEQGSDIAYLCQRNDGAGTLVWSSELSESRDGYASAAYRKNLPGFKPVATIAVAPDKSCHCLTFWPTATDLPHVIDTATEAATDTFMRRVPSLRPTMHKRRAKQRLLARINPLDSDAANEAQIDLLTLALCRIVEAMPKATREHMQSILQNTLGDIPTASILKLRKESELQQDVATHKRKLRGLQQKYFSERGA